MDKMERILVATDFSATSRRALDFALHLAGPVGASICVLHVYYSPRHVSPAMVLDIPDEVRSTFAGVGISTSPGNVAASAATKNPLSMIITLA